MKKEVLALAGFSLAALVASCSGPEKSRHAYGAADGSASVRSGDDDNGDDEQDIALDAIPASVSAAALARLPGLVITAAETETEDGVLVYSLEGTVDGERHEIEVSAAGTVLEVETGADDEDDDDDDDQDDD